MPIMLLDSNAFIGPVGQPPEGCAAHSFFGHIKIPSHGQILAHIKLYPTHLHNPAQPDKPLPNRGLENEAIGYALAKVKGLKVVPRAGFVLLNKEQVNQPPAWVLPEMPAWFSEAVGHPSLSRFLNLTDRGTPHTLHLLKTQLKARSEETAALAAFDETIFNIDRNPGNLLADGTLIDHGSILGGETWHHHQLPNMANQKNPNNRILQYLGDHAEELPFKNTRLQSAMTQTKKYAENQDTVHTLLRETLYDSDPEMAQAVIDFIEKRTTSANSRTAIGLVA